METFDYQGLPIKYVRNGKGDPIIFLHNGGTSHAIWQDVVAQVSGAYETFAIDLLGYGESAKPGSGYTLDKYVAILEAFIAEKRLAPVTLVGNCMGSAMSLAYAARSPQNVRALILVNPLTAATFTAGWLGSTLRLRRQAPGLSQGIYKVLGRLHLNRWMSTQSLRTQFGAIGKTRSLHLREDLCACFTSEGQMQSLLGALDDLVNYGVFDHFEKPAGFPPMCTIWGLENKILSAKAGRKLNETLRPERAEWIERTGHLLMLEAPDQVSTIIQEFLTKHSNQSKGAL